MYQEEAERWCAKQRIQDRLVGAILALSVLALVMLAMTASDRRAERARNAEIEYQERDGLSAREYHDQGACQCPCRGERER